MITPLREAAADTCGGKAAALAALLRAGLPVPDGFVLPFAAHRRAVHTAGRRPTGGALRSSAAGAPGRGTLGRLPEARPAVSAELRSEISGHLAAMGDPSVAVRSSAAHEDTPGASAAGQYESVVGICGLPAVSEAVRTCWASARSARVAAYRRRMDDAGSAGAPGGGDAGSSGTPDMAVLVQRLIDAEVSGVMFTPFAPGDPTRIEASWGLGLSVVGGTVSPDAYEVAADGSVLVAAPAPRKALDDVTAAALAALGRRVAEVLRRPQDIEWAIADGKAWILQARPITAPLPPLPARPSSSGAAPSTARTVLTGVPGAHGTAGGTARVLRSPAELGRVRRGDVVVCRYTEPAWTPVFGIAGAVVTETGGALSHAAIVAREHGIPAVLGVAHATTAIRDGARIAVDGGAGIVAITSD
ncbi:PEP/pyruvate-binding domain-containing protein [Myceligenerans pegani]|uniref:Pyruvate, phosphate dikinase n=1 Tax=Myceligenerans pegani TaxID=2776917 RepID=A0ABR9N1R2_9MICO|nr:PEP/pyruvate-binding domain-containing protein [Myceligenerans sp. TRM 65318]MBE1877592.1 pyruvate, phosphate dikinase [Myceligenerans sp. TRM 65318]MBE3019863.1 pyruvate, phosphate dikinase [Myceligenerans sp. TRM 65318]